MSRRTCFVCSRKTTLAHESVSALCRECRKRPLELISKTEAKQTYKVTDSELTGLPHLHRPNPKYKCAAPMRLYARQQIERLTASDAVQRRLAKHQRRSSANAVAEREAAQAAHWQARSEQRIKRERQFRAAIAKHYPSWREALLPACEVMFNLNRAVIHGRHDKDQIYTLKNRLIKLLYSQGACIECLAHKRTLLGKECYDCDGFGCERCNQSGWWGEPHTVRDFAFKFMVCGRVFAWHQPDHLITFNCEVSATEQGSPKEEKPVEMSWWRMERGKHIIRYVLDNAPNLFEEAA